MCETLSSRWRYGDELDALSADAWIRDLETLQQIRGGLVTAIAGREGLPITVATPEGERTILLEPRRTGPTPRPPVTSGHEKGLPHR